MGQQDEREAFRWYSDNWPLLYRAHGGDAHDMTKNQSRFTTKQAAQAIGVSKETLLRWLYDGLVKEPPRDRRGWRVWTQPDIDRIAAWNSTIQPAPKRQPEPQGAR